MERSAILFVVLLLLAAPAAVFAEGKRPMTIDDLFRFKRVSDPQISPDGKLVVYVVGSVDLDGNKIVLLALAGPHRRGRAAAADQYHQKGSPSALEPRRQAHPLRVQPLAATISSGSSISTAARPGS